MKRYLISESQYRILLESVSPVLYHGGPDGILTKPIKTDLNYRVGRWFTTEPDTAKYYGDVVHSATLSLNKPFVVDAGGAYYYNIPTPSQLKEWTNLKEVDTDIIAEFALEKGFDGAVIKNVLEGNGNGHVSDVYVVFNSNQIQELPDKWTVKKRNMSGVVFRDLEPRK